MRPIAQAAVALCLVALSVAATETNSGRLQQQQEEIKSSKLQQNASEEMHLITKSLENLLGELAAIKQEATGRLSKTRASTSNQERIRQTKVSRFVLRRVAELESESLSMRQELAKIFALHQNELQKEASQEPSKKEQPTLYLSSDQLKQEDHDFDEPQTTATTNADKKPITAQGDSNLPGAPSTTSKPEGEAAKLGFDMEALKKLGEEIGKRLDQFGKDAAKNLGDLIEGADLELELEARQRQNPESLRGVHEQVIKLVDNMVQNYLGNVRRTIQRMTNLIDNRRATTQAPTESKPRQESQAAPQANAAAEEQQQPESFEIGRQSILGQIQALSRQMHDFSIQWARVVGKQQSPLVDRIPPRGVELWRDFWDTVRKQVRRINQEFWQLSQDMSRMLTGRLPPSRGPRPTDSSLLYYLAESSAPESGSQNEARLSKRFQEYYDRMSVALGEEQQKMDKAAAEGQSGGSADLSNLIDEQDDQMTKDELTRNVALRQQIQQEINVFGSIFDIMRAFIQRLRESATSVVRDVMQPGASNNNNNDPVTPGPSVKPQVDKLLGETIESQRNINSQARPVLLPNNRPNVRPRY